MTKARKKKRKFLASGRPRKVVPKLEEFETRLLPGAMFTDTAPTVAANLNTLGYRTPLPPDVPHSTAWTSGSSVSPASGFSYEYPTSPRTVDPDSSYGRQAGASSRGPAASEFIATPAVNLLPEMEPAPGAAPMPGPTMNFQFGGGGSSDGKAPQGFGHSAEQPASGGLSVPWAGMSQPQTPLPSVSTPAPAQSAAIVSQPAVATTSAVTTQAPATSLSFAPAPTTPAITFTPTSTPGTYSVNGLGSYQATVAPTGATFSLSQGIVLRDELGRRGVV